MNAKASTMSNLRTKDGYECTKGSKLYIPRDGSCFQRALANCTGVDFDTIYGKSLRAGIKKLGRGGTSVLGLDKDPTVSVAKTAAKCTGVAGWVPRPELYRFGTINAFVAQFSRGTFLLGVRGHALAVRDGVVYDNGDRSSGRHRILEVVEYRPQAADRERDELRAKLNQRAHKLRANFQVYTGAELEFTEMATVTAALGREDYRKRLPVKTWDLLQRYAVQLEAFGTLW